WRAPRAGGGDPAARREGGTLRPSVHHAGRVVLAHRQGKQGAPRPALLAGARAGCSRGGWQRGRESCHRYPGTPLTPSKSVLKVERPVSTGRLTPAARQKQSL